MVHSNCDCIKIIGRASNIPRHAHFHALPWNSLFAAEFAACHGKTRNCLVFATFISNSRFSGSFLILPFIEQ